MCSRPLLSLSRTPALRRYSTPSRPQKSPYAQWYSETVPAMIPIFLLGSAVYLGLQLTQIKLSHEKYMEDASKRIQDLEAEVELLQSKRVMLTKDVASAAPAPVQFKPSRGWW
ncbi:hypothetical protein BDQ17DRAFT_1422081 [Cyathus striatus]|nr:hypothetical protein BDQ17DRAFT_1422081 [Cyathus striatus]